MVTKVNFDFAAVTFFECLLDNYLVPFLWLLSHRRRHGHSVFFAQLLLAKTSTREAGKRRGREDIDEEAGKTEGQ